MLIDNSSLIKINLSTQHLMHTFPPLALVALRSMSGNCGVIAHHSPLARRAG
jgi:hypothetical protein